MIEDYKIIHKFINSKKNLVDFPKPTFDDLQIVWSKIGIWKFNVKPNCYVSGYEKKQAIAFIVRDPDDILFCHAVGSTPLDALIKCTAYLIIGKKVEKI